MASHRERLKRVVCLLIDVLFDIAEERTSVRASPKRPTRSSASQPVKRRHSAPMRPIVEDDIEVDEATRERVRKWFLRRGRVV
jgi:hypothetical protein